MNVFLLHPDRAADPDQEPLPLQEDVRRDLGIQTICEAMALGDPFLATVADRTILASLENADEISFRQRVLADCISHPEVLRELYAITVSAIEEKRQIYYPFRSPELVLHSAVKGMEMFAGKLRELRAVADAQSGGWESAGFATFFTMLRRELDDEYLASVDEHLEALRFRRGLLMSAQLGPGNKGRRYRLLRPLDTSIGWREWLGVPKRSPYTYRVPDRDESGAQALAGLRVRGVNEVANALAQSADHILGFFTSLQWELGFYVGCLNLHEQLVEKHEPLCVPSPLPAGTVGVESEGLYDVGLTLRTPERTVGNTLEGAGKQLVMITGANQGGKSTFLRAVGVAQLMFQCGMYVGAESYSAAINAGVFTHFKRGEDLTMKSGKLDEELSRMSEIVDRLRPGSLLLLNESFAATNEREGSEVARQVVQSLLEAGVTIVYVTHLFHLTQSVLAAHQPTTLFLRAERASSGERSFRLVRAAPLSTSFGEDIYRRIFADRVKASE